MQTELTPFSCGGPRTRRPFGVPTEIERTLISQFPRLSNATSYQRNCAVCHTSQLRLARQDDSTMQHAVFREPGVNCEVCHGPSARHAADPGFSGETPFRFSKLDHVRATLIRGQCHRQSAIRNPGPGGEMNYGSNPPYYNRLLSQPLAEFGNRAFYKDGRFRETTFLGEAFMRSACFRRGTAQCALSATVSPSSSPPIPAGCARSSIRLSVPVSRRIRTIRPDRPGAAARPATCRPS